MQVDKPYFKKHINWLMCLGIDLAPLTENVWYKSYYKLYSSFIVILMTTYTVLEVIDVIDTSDIKNITFGLCYIASHILGITKMLVLIAKKENFWKMMKKLESGNFLPSFNRGGLEEYRLVKAAITRCNNHMKWFHLMGDIIVSIQILYAFFNTGYYEEFDHNLNTTTLIYKKTLPFRVWLPLDTSKSSNFAFAFVLQVVCLLLFGHHIGLSDSLVYGMMIHVNTQYLILKGVINKYVSSVKDLQLDDVEGLETRRSRPKSMVLLPKGCECVLVLPDYLQEKIKGIIDYCTKHHNEIFSFCEQIESEFRYLMLLQFLFSLYILCFQLYHLSLSTSAFSFDFVSMCLYLMLMMYQLFCYCWYGNEVMLQSQMLAEDLYNSDWLLLNDSIKKSILLIMMRAQRPVQFTAGKFALLSLQTFMTAVRTLCKVYPSPGIARSVWELPQTASCNMVADTDHPATVAKDGGGEADIAEQTHRTIFDLVKAGELSEISEHVEKSGTEVLRARDEWGYTPAHWVALDGNVEIMRYIVDRGGPIDLPCLGTQGPRPIHWACRKGHAALVQVLLQAGVAVNTADFKGLTPLMTACMFGRTATAAYLLGMGAANDLMDINGDTALHWAAYKGHADLIRLLMYSGTNLQRPDHFGSAPLHLACLSGGLTCVKLLCEKSNINLEPLDKNDKTPLMLALSHRHSDIVELLQTEKKRRSSWFPPINELWGLLFGKAGNSKAPLIFFMSSVLLWGYPMYVVRCIPITWNILRGSHYCFIYWNIVMWVCWFVANRKNPGYVPMNSESYHRSIKQIPMFDKWKKRNAILNRLCHTCRCLRPLRAKHCRICNRCVSYFDHHCPFIYNCVGLRNRTWFFLFVMSIAVNCSFTIYFAMYCIAIEGFGILYILGLLEAFVFSGLGWILTCTSILHACMNLTTNEMFNYKRYPYLRDKRGRYLNPFSRGPILNLVEFFFCTPEDYDDDYGYELI